MTDLMNTWAVTVARSVRRARSAVQRVRADERAVLFCRKDTGWPSWGAATTFRFMLLATVLVSLGCTSIDKKIEDESVRSIEIGRSTKEDVLDILGLPNRTEQTSAGDIPLDVWIYYRGEGRQTFSTAFYAPTPVTTGGMRWWVVFGGDETSEQEEKMAVLVAFDETGTVADVKEQSDETHE